jgi:hypothetical protein
MYLFGLAGSISMDTLIPLFFLELNPAQAAIDEGVEMPSLSIKRFEGAAKDLLDQHANCANLQEVIRAFVRGCQHGCTGNLNWRSVTLISTIIA